MLRSFTVLALVPVLLTAQSPKSPARPRAPGNEIITTAKMRADLEFLAGDALRGRLTDTPENAIALEWMKSRFQGLGLKPMGSNGSFFQRNGLSLGVLGDGNDLTVTRGEATSHYGLATGFYPL